MKYIKKIIVPEIIIIISCLIFTVPANAAGFIFHWEPLVIANNLALSNTAKKDFIKNSSIFEWSPLRSKMTFRLQDPEAPTKNAISRGLRRNPPAGAGDCKSRDLKIIISDDYMDTFVLSTNHEGASTQKKESKSIPKINFSLAYGLMDNKSQIYSNSDDKQISNFINAITSLIYDDSKFKSLETIGKIIEPQINFYFEF